MRFPGGEIGRFCAEARVKCFVRIGPYSVKYAAGVKKTPVRRTNAHTVTTHKQRNYQLTLSFSCNEKVSVQLLNYSEWTWLLQDSDNNMRFRSKVNKFDPSWCYGLISKCRTCLQQLLRNSVFARLSSVPAAKILVFHAHRCTIQNDSDVISSYIYVSWFSPPSCR